jgi:hypothetical protein
VSVFPPAFHAGIVPCEADSDGVSFHCHYRIDHTGQGHAVASDSTSNLSDQIASRETLGAMRGDNGMGGLLQSGIGE